MPTIEHPTTAAEVLQQLDERGLLAKRDEPRPVARGGTLQASERPPAATVVVQMEMDDGHGGKDIAGLFGALAKAQGEFGSVERSQTARIKSKREGGADYAYDYAPLDVVLAAVRPALSRNGIAIMQFPLTRSSREGGGSVLVRTLLAHESGQRIWNDLAVGCVSTDAKDVGSAITYARRYALQALLGIAPDHDDDGLRARGARGETGPRQPQQRRDPPQVESEPAGEKIVSCREIKRGDKKAYEVRTSRGACYTEDRKVYEAAVAALKAERPVVLATESRTDAQGRKYPALIEIS